MKTISRHFYRMPVNVLFFTVVPLFFFLFVLGWRPFDLENFLAVGKDRYTLNLIIATLIVLGVMSLSRMLLFILRNIIDLNWALYAVWCVGEAVVCGLFLTIPMGIGWAGELSYVAVLSRCVLYMMGILVFPLTILSMGVQLVLLDRAPRGGENMDEKQLIRFKDPQQRLKLVVASEAVLYLQAEDNYVRVFHLDNDKVKEVLLRASMNSLEELLKRHGLVRCHRSYFLNPVRVEILRKDDKGFFEAVLDRPGLDAIPVSKRYYDAVTAALH